MDEVLVQALAGLCLTRSEVDGIISSENADEDGGRVSSDNCFKINKIKLEYFVLYNFNELN